MNFDCKKALSDLSESEIEKVLAQLAKDHSVLDEHNNFLSSDLIEYCAEKIEHLFREHGYKGERLEMTGKFFANHGAVYCLYESNELNREQALEYMEGWVKNYKY